MIDLVFAATVVVIATGAIAAVVMVGAGALVLSAMVSAIFHEDGW